MSVLGIILLVIPFLLVSFFKDKKKGFVFVLLFVLLLHTVVAFISQLFSVFYYDVILAANILADVVVVLLYLKYRKTKQTFSFRIDWIFLAVILVSLACFYRVHYNYTGSLSVINDAPNLYHNVKDYKYNYPYFSDEWYSISFIKSSIATHHLPITNPLNYNLPFVNLEVFTRSLLSEIVLLLGMDPLNQYIILTIAINLLIISLIYIFLHLAGASKLSASFCSLSTLYIVSAANLPGIWHLIPITFGIIFILIGFCFIALDNLKMSLLSLASASLFYPLLFPFYIPALGVFIYGKLGPYKEKILAMGLYILTALLVGIPVISIILIVSPWGGPVKYVFSRLFYVSLANSFLPGADVLYLIPFPIIILAIWGLLHVFKKQNWLFWPLVIGIIYWAYCMYEKYRIILEFERAAYFTSITTYS